MIFEDLHKLNIEINTGGYFAANDILEKLD